MTVYQNPQLTFFEVIMMLVIFLGILFFIFRHSKKYKNKEIRQLFVYAAIAKLFGGQMVCLIYLFIYGYGDTFRFFRFGLMYRDLLLYSKEYSFLGAVTMNSDQFQSSIGYLIDFSYGFAESSLIINKISGIISIFTFDSFLATTLFFSLFSFSGSWKMYTSFIKLYPKLYKDLAVAILFLPSVVFWGSGLLKDSICIGAIGWAVWGFHGLFFEQKQSITSRITHIFAIGFSTWLLGSIKTYILLSFLIGMFAWIFLSYRERIKNETIRKLSLPILTILSIPPVLFGLQSFSEELGKYAIENIIDTALQLNYNLQKLEAGSAYSLGAINPSLTGMLSKVPAAINVTLFRPYLWEANNATMLIAAIESLLLLLLFLYIFAKIKLVSALNALTSKGILIFCFSYSLIFSFAVGLSTGNFGSLVRYKIPAVPFFLIGLFILYFEVTGKSIFSTKTKKKSALQNHSIKRQTQ